MIPDSLGEYTITRLLGRGSMAEVYEGFDADLDRPVAIKVILPAIGGEPGFEARFRRETRLVTSLRHPHIVQVFDFDVVDGKPFMVMEYLKGNTLKDRLAELRGRGETMPFAEIARNPARSCFRCLVSLLIGGSLCLRSRGVFHGGSHSFKIQRTSAYPRRINGMDRIIASPCYYRKNWETVTISSH